MTILIDSSFLYALYNQGDTKHQIALSFALKNRGATLVPDVVLPEVCFLFERDFGHYAIIKFLGEFAGVGVPLQAIDIDDVRKAQAIMTKYPKAEFDFVDCCVMALAERLNITQICTFDRRDFALFKPTHCDFLELLP